LSFDRKDSTELTMLSIPPYSSGTGSTYPLNFDYVSSEIPSNIV